MSRQMKVQIQILREHIPEHLLWFVVHGQMANLQLNLERKLWRQIAEEKEKDELLKKDDVVHPAHSTI